MRDELESYVLGHAQEIDRLDGAMLDRHLEGLMDMLSGDTLTISDEESYDISGRFDVRDILEAIFEEITREEDRIAFANAVVRNESKVGTIAADSFRTIANTQTSTTDETTTTEEQNEINEPEIETPTNTPDTDFSEPTEENEEELEEPEIENVEEQQITPEQIGAQDGPEITAYKAETARLEQELMEKMAQLEQGNNQPEIPQITEDVPENTNENDIVNLIETLSNSINTNNEIRKELNEKFNFNLSIKELDEGLKQILQEATKVEAIEKEIKEQEELIASLDNNIEALRQDLETKKQQAEQLPKLIDTPSREEQERNRLLKQSIIRLEYTLRKFEEEKEEKINELSKLKRKKEVASKSAVYLDADQLRNICMQQINEINNTLNSIANKRNKLQEKREHVPYELQLEDYNDQTIDGKGTYTSRLNALQNQLFEASRLIENRNRDININKRPEPTETPTTTDPNEDLINEINRLREEITNRKAVENQYYDALNDIRNIAREIASGKTPNDEEVISKINAVKEKIEPLPSEPQNLKGELEQYLELALTVKPPVVEKDHSKRNKWIAGIAGFALGAAVIGLTPLGMGAAIGISVGSQVVRLVASHLHKKYKQEAAELGRENIITGIERTSKLAQLKEKFKNWISKDENMQKINWFLTGTALGAMTAGIAETIIANIPDTSLQTGGANTPTYPGTSNPPGNNIPNIKVGDSMNGMDLSTGYDHPTWAIDGTNPEALNQTIMNDGNTVVRRIMDAQGNTYMSTEEAINAGKSLSELSLDGASGLGLDDSLSRAWVNAGKALGR